MGLQYILKQSGAKIGLDPNDQGQRDVLLRFANEAMQELYEQADSEGSLREQLFVVNGDQQIALPLSVGPLRAMREYSTHVAWHLHNMRPRYNQVNWTDRWRSWRIKGITPLTKDVTNEAPLIVTVKAVESPNITVRIVGSTEDSEQVMDTFVMDDISKTGVVPFTAVKAIRKDRVNAFNVTVLDADNNEMSVIANNVLEAKYRLVDVSLYPWSNAAVGPVDHYMEVLYKEALPWMQNDEDEYPTIGHDNIIVNKICQIWAEEQGKGDVAAGFDGKATRSLARKKEDEKRGTEEEVAMVENPHDTLLPRNRPMGPSRYMGQIYY